MLFLEVKTCGAYFKIFWSEAGSMWSQSAEEDEQEEQQKGQDNHPDIMHTPHCPIALSLWRHPLHQPQKMIVDGEVRRGPVMDSGICPLPWHLTAVEFDDQKVF